MKGKVAEPEKRSKIISVADRDLRAKRHPGTQEGIGIKFLKQVFFKKGGLIFSWMFLCIFFPFGFVSFFCFNVERKKTAGSCCF